MLCKRNGKVSMRQTLKAWCYYRRQEAYLGKGVIASQQAHQINRSTYQDNTGCNEWYAAPPLIQPSWNPSLRDDVGPHLGLASGGRRRRRRVGIEASEEEEVCASEGRDLEGFGGERERKRNEPLLASEARDGWSRRGISLAKVRGIDLSNLPPKNRYWWWIKCVSGALALRLHDVTLALERWIMAPV